jgi:hypothetical protein
MNKKLEPVLAVLGVAAFIAFGVPLVLATAMFVMKHLVRWYGV